MPKPQSIYDIFCAGHPPHPTKICGHPHIYIYSFLGMRWAQTLTKDIIIKHKHPILAWQAILLSLLGMQIRLFMIGPSLWLSRFWPPTCDQGEVRGTEGEGEATGFPDLIVSTNLLPNINICCNPTLLLSTHGLYHPPNLRVEVFTTHRFEKIVNSYLRNLSSVRKIGATLPWWSTQSTVTADKPVVSINSCPGKRLITKL